MVRAQSSLPVPVSPVMRTVDVVVAAASTRSTQAVHGAAPPRDGRHRGRRRRPRPASARAERELVAHAADRSQELLHLERLLQVVARALRMTRDRVLRSAYAVMSTTPASGCTPPRAAEQVEAVHAGQPHVGEDEVERLALQRRGSGGAVRACRDVVASVLERVADRDPDDAVVLGEQELHAAECSLREGARPCARAARTPFWSPGSGREHPMTQSIAVRGGGT